MTVGAASGGGGVGTLTYDTNSAEETSVMVSGGLGESETGGPVMNLVPRSGGNGFAGQSFFNTAGEWSSGTNVDDFLRGIGIVQGGGVISAYDGSVSLGGPIKRDRIWFFGSYRKLTTAQGVEGIFGNVYAFDASHWDYLKNPNLSVRAQGRTLYQVWSRRRSRPESRDVAQQTSPAASSSEFENGDGQLARRRLGGPGSTALFRRRAIDISISRTGVPAT
jgi:hypothetical protein